MAARAIVVSVLLHVSVAVAVTGGGRGGARAGDRGLPVDTDLIEIASPEVVVDEPRPVTIPEENAPSPSLSKPAIRDSSHATKGASAHPAKVATAGGEGPPGLEAPPAVVAAPASAPARFVMSFGTAATSTGGPSSASSSRSTAASGDGVGTDPYPESGVSSRARLLGGSPPEYPSAARTAGVEADVPLEIVVSSAGAVVDARPLRHVGYGLDEAALRAVRAFRFTPARREGREVAVRMRWVVDFRLD
jgi:protein TonB